MSCRRVKPTLSDRWGCTWEKVTYRANNTFQLFTFQIYFNSLFECWRRPQGDKCLIPTQQLWRNSDKLGMWKKFQTLKQNFGQSRIFAAGISNIFVLHFNSHPYFNTFNLVMGVSSLFAFSSNVRTSCFYTLKTHTDTHTPWNHRHRHTHTLKSQTQTHTHPENTLTHLKSTV